MGPDGAGAFGTAAYANAPTIPTNSSNALNERFMFTFSLGSSRKVAGDLPPSERRELYTTLQLSHSSEVRCSRQDQAAQ